MAYTDYFVTKGKTCVFIGRKPLQLREEKPYKPPQ
jgi:hypothetical protein